MSFSHEFITMDGGPVPISRWRVATLHVLFFLLAAVSAVSLRAPIWLIGALVYCSKHRGTLIGERLFPSRLWKVLLASLVASTACSVVANVVTRLLCNTAWVQKAVWKTLYPLWALLGVQQWDAADYINTIVCPGATVAVLGAYLFILKRSLAGRALSRNGGIRTVQDRSVPWNLLPRRAGMTLAAHRLPGGPLVSLFSWAVAWIAEPSVVGFCLEGFTFVFVAAFLYVEHRTWKLLRRAVRNRNRVQRDIPHTFGTAAAVILVCVCVTQNSAFFVLTNVYGDWCKLLGMGPAALDTTAGLRYAMQMMGMAGVFLGATVMHCGTESSESTTPDSSAEAAVPASGEAARLLVVGNQPVPPTRVPDVSLPSTSVRDEGLPNRYRRAQQVAAIACMTALLSYAIYYPSLVSTAVWLLHLCCCAGGLVQSPMTPHVALRIVIASVLVVLCCTILVQYVFQALARNPCTEGWRQWAPARPAYPDDGRAVCAQVVAEHLIFLLFGVYVSAAGLDGTGVGGSSGHEGAEPVVPLRSSLVSRVGLSTEANAHLDDSAEVTWLRAELSDAAGDRKKLCHLFLVAVGRSPRTIELDTICAAAAQESRTSSPVTSREGLTVKEVMYLLASGPFYTYAVVLCTFVLGTSGASMDLLHAACLVLSLGVSVMGGNAMLYRRVRTVPPVCVAIVVGLRLCCGVFAAGDEKPPQQQQLISAGTQPSFKFALWNYLCPTSLTWKDGIPYLCAQLVLMWCSRYMPKWLTNWTHVAQCLAFRCRWSRFIGTVHQIAGVVVLAWIAVLLPRSASVTVLILLLFTVALLQLLRLRRLAYVWRRFLVVGYCGVVLMCMLTAEFEPVRSRLWQLLRAFGCPAGSEGRCAQDIGLPADSAMWLTPLSIPWWLIIVLATTTARPHPLPSSLPFPADAAPVTGALEALTTRFWWALAWWPKALSDALSFAILAGMVHTALKRPSVLAALYLVGPGLGVFPCWTFGVSTLHAALQCTYQLWFSPVWLDAQTRFGVSPAEFIGLWRPSSATSPAVGLPSTLVVAAAPLLIGVAQYLQLQCALLAQQRERNRAAAFLGQGRTWCQLRRTCATHLYMLLLWVLLYLTQKIALGWGVGVLIKVVWMLADVRKCGVLQQRRWLYAACRSATAFLMALAYFLHWVHTVFPQCSIVAMHPYLLGGSSNDEKTMTAMDSVCWAAAAACVMLRVSSGAPRGSESEYLFCHSHSPSFVDWLRRYSRQLRENHEYLSASLAEMSPDDICYLFRDVAGVCHCDEAAAEESGTSPLGTSPAPPSKGNVIVSVARRVPLVGCGSVAVASAMTSSPCVLRAALLLAGLCLVVRHPRLHWSFWRWWRLTVALYALLPLIALVAACPWVRDLIPALPLWVGLLIGWSPDASHVDGNTLVFSCWHIMLFSCLWLQSCVYNCPQSCTALLRQQGEERLLGEARHATLQKQLLLYMANATEKVMRLNREVCSYLDALRAGDDMAGNCHLYPRGSPEYVEEDSDEQSSEAERVRTSMPSPPPMTPVLETEEVNEVLGSAGEPPRSPLLSPGVEGMSNTPAPSLDHAQLPTLRWWQQWCVWWLRRICEKLAWCTYHPSEYRLPAAAADSSVLTLWPLSQYALHIAAQVALRHTTFALLGCLVINSLLTGCLWELIGLSYVVQVVLAYHPHPPRLVCTALGVYLVTGMLLKEAASMWTFLGSRNSSLITALSWILLPLKEECRGSSSSTQMCANAPSSPGPLRYNTLWMDLVTVGVLVLHGRVCIIQGVYVERDLEQSMEHDSADMSMPLEGPASSSGGAPLSNSVTAETTALLSASFLLTPISHGTSIGSTFCALVTDYSQNLLTVPGVGEDWYISYTSVDSLALIMVAVCYSRIAGNNNGTLQDNVQNNLLPGPMALLLCVSVLQLVMDRMMYVQRSMRMKALANGVCAILYALFYWWWRNAVTVSEHATGNVYFSLKVVALVLSVTQVCRGFPVHRHRHIFTTHLNSLFSYSFTIYRSLPFLWELRTLVDWTVLRTSLSLQEYLTVEDIYVYVYQCRDRYLAKYHNNEKLGHAVSPLAKWAFGVSRLTLILLALLGPLLYYSTYNPSTVANNATQLNFQLSFFGAYDFFATTVHDNVTTPEGWRMWIERTRPTLGSYGLMAAGKTVQLMEFTSCSSSLWMASPQAVRDVLNGLRAAASNSSNAYMLQTLEVSRSVSSTDAAAAVSLVNRWPIPWDTAQDLVAILERETGGTREAAVVDSQNSRGSSIVVGSASLPFFYSPFALNRAGHIDKLPASLQFPHRNQHNCTLELNHDRDIALNSLVRYWCLHCAPLFPEGNIPSANSSSAAEWRCLTTGEECENFNYEDAAGTRGSRTVRAPFALQMNSRMATKQAPMYMVIISDTVVMGISLLKGIGIVALYTTFVLALGRLLRSVLANQVSTLLYSNMANPVALQNMLRCMEMAREYGDLRLEHAIYIELMDLLRSTERLFRVTGSLRCMYRDAGHEDLFGLRQVRRRNSRRHRSVGAHEEANERDGDSGVPAAVSHSANGS